MQLFQLERFIEIAKYDSIHTAAEQLFLSTQSLSKSIQVLEKELDTTLFERSPKGIELTSDGLIFLNFALQTVANYNTMYGKLSHHSKKKQPIASLSGKLAIFHTPLFSDYLLPSAIRNFYFQNSDVRLSISSAITTQIVEILTSPLPNETEILGLLTVPYVNGQPALDELALNDSYELVPLSTCRYVCCTALRSPYAKNHSISTRQLLKNEKIISFASQAAEAAPIDLSIRQFGDPNYVLATASPSIFLDAVSNGLGIGMINEVTFENNEFFRTHKNEIALLRLNPPPALLCCASFHKEHHTIIDRFMQLFPVLKPT